MKSEQRMNEFTVEQNLVREQLELCEKSLGNPSSDFMISSMDSRAMGWSHSISVELAKLWSHELHK